MILDSNEKIFTLAEAAKILKTTKERLRYLSRYKGWQPQFFGGRIIVGEGEITTLRSMLKALKRTRPRKTRTT